MTLKLSSEYYFDPVCRTGAVAQIIIRTIVRLKRMKYSWAVLPGSAESVSDGMSEMRQIARDAPLQQQQQQQQQRWWRCHAQSRSFTHASAQCSASVRPNLR